MRQSFAPTVSALILLLLAALPAVAQVVSVEPISHDFGDMKQQQTVTTSVTVTNKGAGLLEIQKVEADCGCTIPTLTKTSLGPGESTEIMIEFNSQKFHGKVFKAVHINTNDPLNPLVDVMLTARVHTPLIIDPSTQRLGLGKTLRGETVSKRAVMTATGDMPLVISADKSRQGLFGVKVINNLDGDPKKAALEVTVPKSMSPGRQRDNVRVTTNIAEMPTVDFEVRAWVVQELTYMPDRLNFRFRKEFVQSISLVPYRKPLTFKVTGAECDLPEISLEVLDTMPDEDARVMITGRPISNDDPRAIAAKGRMAGTIKVFTDLENTPVIEIPITYMVRM